MKSTIHENQKNKFTLLSKNLFRKLQTISLIAIASLSIISCEKGNPNENPNQNTKKTKLLQIRSNSIDNASNLWDLQRGNLVPSIATLTTFSNVRIADPIASPAGLLSQTTMTWQSSAYDKINKKYSVSLAETVVTYDLSGMSVPAPTVDIVASSGTGSLDTYILAMEYVSGVLYVIHDNEIKTLSGGITSSIGGGIIIPTSIGVTSNTVSNMTSNGTKIYFALSGKLFTFDTITSTLSSFGITGWMSDVDYNGIEYCASTNVFYATKRYSSSPSTDDDFVRIDLSGNESTMFTGMAYPKDFSRISSALDQATNIYYLSSSDGFGTNSNTITEINVLSGSQMPYLGNAGYAFGLEIKN
jgi:hypothetical protein